MKKDLYRKTCLVIFIITTVFKVSAQQTISEIPDTSYFRTGDTAFNLVESVLRNQAPTTRLLLDRGVDPNVKSKTGSSPLIYATEKGNMEIMRMLVEYGADVNQSGFKLETPLLTAIFHNDFQSAKYLLEQGADPNIKDEYGVTPLLYAAASNQYQSADLLLFYGADPNVTDKDGNNALLAAVTFENIETADVLLQNELDPDIQDNKGNTPTIVATQRGRYDILELLLEYHSNVNLANKKNYTALAYAMTYNDVKAAKMLIEHGADVNHEVENGRNIYDLARLSTNDTLLNIVKDAGGNALPGVDFGEFNLNFGSSFNSADYFVQLRGSFVDGRHGYFLETGMDFRPFLIRIQTSIDGTDYQFREQRLGWSHAAGKYFEFYKSKSGITLGTYAMVTGFLSFPDYKGTQMDPLLEYRVIPGAGIMLKGQYVGFRAGLEWYKYPNTLDKGLKYNLTLLFRIAYPEVEYDRKEIYWD